MFFLTKPSDEKVLTILAGLVDAPFTYPQVGITKERLAEAPSGFLLDTYSGELGQGEEVFERAKTLISRCDNYPPSFTRVVLDGDQVKPGAMFAPVANHMGFYSVHPCRVIYMIDEEAPKRYGFGMGTLNGHAERGEERFRLTLDEQERVIYDVQAFSRPVGLARIGAPVVRAFQRRFQRETLDTMRQRSRG